jgi:hypothetical protein
MTVIHIGPFQALVYPKVRLDYQIFKRLVRGYSCIYFRGSLVYVTVAHQESVFYIRITDMEEFAAINILCDVIWGKIHAVSVEHCALSDTVHGDREEL